MSEDAELNITAEDFDAIHSEGDLTISGSGTINATSEREVAINASGDLTITGSGNVNANEYYDSIRANASVTIDSTGSVVANGAVRGEGPGHWPRGGRVAHGHADAPPRALEAGDAAITRSSQD